MNRHSFTSIIQDGNEQRSTLICCLSPRLRDSLYIATNSWFIFRRKTTDYPGKCDRDAKKAIKSHFLFIELHVTVYTHSICALTNCESQLPNTHPLKNWGMQKLPSEMQVALPQKQNFGVKWSRDPNTRDATQNMRQASLLVRWGSRWVVP